MVKWFSRRQLAFSFCALILVLAWSSLNWGATLDDEIKAQLQNTPENRFVCAILVLSPQENLRPIAGADAKITALKQMANRTQRRLIANLSKARQEGSVKSYRPFWIFNGIQVTAMPRVIKHIAARPEVRMILPDFFYPRPQIFYNQMQHTQSQPAKANPAKRIWEEFHITGNGITIGVLGTGAQPSAANLRATYRGGGNSWFDACASKAKPYDDAGLSTAMLSAITGRPLDQQPSSIAPGANWIAAKVMNQKGGYASWIYAGLQWVADADGDPQTPDAPQVINVADFARDVACAKAVDNLCQMGIFCVMTVGLDVDIPPDLWKVPLPANPFAVGALDDRDVETSFGKHRSVASHPQIVPDLSAPSTNLYVTSTDGMVRLARAEIFACAQVMGTVALLRQANPGLNVADLRWVLKRTALDLGEPGIDSVYGAGKLDPYAAVRYTLAELANPSFAERALMNTTLGVIPQRLVVDLMVGQTETQTVMVSNRGQDTLSIKISMENSAPWLDFQPKSLTIEPDAAGLLTISCDARQVGAGDYATEIEVASEHKAITLPIALSVRTTAGDKREFKGVGAANRPNQVADEAGGFFAFGDGGSGNEQGGEEGRSRRFVFEAEEASSLTPYFEVAPDEGASGASYVHAPKGSGGEAGTAEYQFEVKEAGEYEVVGRVRGWSNANSFYITMDNGLWYTWHLENNAGWTWQVATQEGVRLQGNRILIKSILRK